jgi:hypothetical protein
MRRVPATTGLLVGARQRRCAQVHLRLGHHIICKELLRGAVDVQHSLRWQDFLDSAGLPSAGVQSAEGVRRGLAEGKSVQVVVLVVAGSTYKSDPKLAGYANSALGLWESKYLKRSVLSGWRCEKG